MAIPYPMHYFCRKLIIMIRIFSVLATVSIFSLLTACIGDDIIFDTVEERINITNGIDTLGLGEEYQFEATFFNNVGKETVTELVWASSDNEIVSITESGLAKALTLGEVEIYSTANIDGKIVTDTSNIVVGGNTVEENIVLSGELKTAGNYVLEGSFTVEAIEDNIRITLAEDYKMSTGVPGPYVYLSNNPSSINDAYEIGKVEVFSGEHIYDISDIQLTDYQYILYWCKPFSVKLGEGKME